MTASRQARPAVIPRGRARAIFGGTFALWLAADVATKVWAVAALEPATPRPLVGSLLQLYLIRNPGAAFSIGDSATWVFTLLAAVALGFILVRLVPRLAHRWWALGLGLVAAGIAGNLIDRLVRPPAFGRGHVVDFLMLPHWPIFNVADICVTGGALFTVVMWSRTGLGVDGLPESGAEPEPEEES